MFYEIHDSIAYQIPQTTCLEVILMKRNGHLIIFHDIQSAAHTTLHFAQPYILRKKQELGTFCLFVMSKHTTPYTHTHAHTITSVS